MLEINSDITIKTAEIRFDFVRSSGPGGQNVNKVASAVQLRFDIRNSTSIPDEIKQRLIKLAGKRVNSEGILLIDARTSRSQSQNRAEALERLKTLILKALHKPKPRRKTRPTAASKEKRLRNKKARGNLKRLRGNVKDDD
ncbi:aminoacyl-tRNA hydrolase [Candidatus Marinimicrobia bacterium MT.SAG.3]|nr:aminoacyl-tRNA hydrolase [Candidatus Marinimicrobia bacterium MT.SAG.3]TFB14016.1 aminoacyl-tRNA hydrolase [Candidatus Marinimicrobia bacterium MT.SAG.4]